MANDVIIHVKQAGAEAVGASLHGLSEKAKAVGASLHGLSEKAKGVGGVLGSALKMGAIGGATAIAGIGIASIKTAMDFEHGMSQVGAVSQATKEELKGLTKEALRIGKETAFSASEASAAMEILAANGISAKDIMAGAAAAAVDLAAAGGTDLKTAADVASTSMAVWGLKTEEMKEAVNRLAGAANVSRFGVEDMAGAIAMGGGAAASAGVEFGDFTTAIAAIAPSFASGSDAGTSFKQFMAGLTPSAAPAKKALRELGIITAEAGNRFFDAKGNLKSMADITNILHVATKDLSEQQKAQALETIFGSDAMRAAAAISKLTGEEFQRMSDTMKNTDAAAVAKARMDNFKGSLEALKGSIETVMITVGLKFMPVLKKLADWAAVELPIAFEKVEKAIGDWLKAHKDELKAFFDGFREFVDAKVIPALVDAIKQLQQFLGDAIPIIKDATKWLGEHELALAGVGLAFGALAISIGGPLVTIAVLGAAITVLLAHWDDIRNKTTEVIASIRGMDVIGPIFDAIVKIVSDKITAYVDVARRMITIGEEIIDFFSNVFHGRWSEAWENVKTIAENTLHLFLDFLQLGFLGTIKSLLESLKPWEWVEAGFNELKEQAGIALDAVVAFFAVLPDRIRGALGDVASWLSDIPRDFYNAGWDAIEALMRGMGSRIGELRGWIKRNIIDTINPLNWDIPGLSPFEQAFEHAGQIAMGQFAGGLEDSRPKILAAIYDINKSLSTIGEGAVRDQLKANLAALLAELDAATVAAAGLTPPSGTGTGGSTPPSGNTTPPAPRITQSAATLLRGALSGFSNVPSLGFFEGPLTRGGSFAALIAYLNSQAGQAGQNVSRLLTAIGRASTASGTDLLQILRNNGLSFHGGGIVPGPIGSEQLVVAQGGERFLGPGESGGNVYINNYVQAWDSRDVERWFDANADRMASAVERSRGRQMR